MSAYVAPEKIRRHRYVYVFLDTLSRDLLLSRCVTRGLFVNCSFTARAFMVLAIIASGVAILSHSPKATHETSSRDSSGAFQAS